MRVKDDIKNSKIYQATISLTSRVGLAGLTMANIAQAAGIATGSVYTYYSSKVVLINEIYKQTLSRYEERLYDDIAFDEAVDVNLRKVFFNYMHYLQAYREEWIFQDQYYFSPYAVKNHDMQQTTDAMFLPLTQILEQGQSIGLIKPVPTNYFIYLLHGFGHEVSAAVHMGLETFDEILIENSFSLYWSAIKQ